ncbi:MAG: T9SS type A sorting domain-containing protein [candidate division WOR-3 bacterium]
MVCKLALLFMLQNLYAERKNSVPTIGKIYDLKAGEFLIDTSVIYMPVPNDETHPSVAFDGTNYFVVWEDSRSGSTSDIYGARVSQDGTVLDPNGIAISTATGYQGIPSVAFDGTNYLVVWEDFRSGSYDIYGARVALDGTVLDPNGIAISTATNDQEHPSVAFDGTNYFVVWEDSRSGSTSDIYGARVSPDGTVIDQEGIAISTAISNQFVPSVSFDGTNYLVVWQDDRSLSSFDIYGARVSPDGAVLDPNGIAISTSTSHQFSPSVAFSGMNYLVVWHDQSASSVDIYGARVTQNGAVLDSDGILISIITHSQYVPSVAFDGTNYFVVWMDNRNNSYDIYGARVSPGGFVFDPTGVAVSTLPGDEYYPSVSFDGTNYFVVWVDTRNGSYDIYGARVNTGGTVLDPNGIAISTATGAKLYPSVTFDGTNYLIVWEDYRSGSSDIYGARVSQGGTVLDPNGIAISTATGYQGCPSVVFDGTNYFVVWHDLRSGSSDIYGARVALDGTVIDPNGVAISTATGYQLFPSVVFDGTNYFVVWEDKRSGSSDIYGARVNTGGTVLDPNGIAISTATGNQSVPSVAFDGTNYFVVWEDYRSGSFSDIYGAKVSPNGNVIEEFSVSTQSGSQYSPALAHGSGNQVFITYSGYVGYINNHPVNAMRIWGKFYPFVEIGEKINIPKVFISLYIQPNPLNYFTKIRYYLPKSSNVMLKLYDVKGGCLKTFVNGKQDAGIYEIRWDRKNERDRKILEGIYFLRLETDYCTVTRKILIMD